MDTRIKKAINGFNWLYEIYEDGSVYSLTHLKFIKQHLMNSGYYFIALYKKGKAYSSLVHRLVADNFIDNPEKKKCVNHKDGNRLNNHYTNLEWSTHRENTHHAMDSGISFKRKGEKFGETHYNAKFTEADIIQIREAYEDCGSYSVIARKFNVAPPTIMAICKRKTWKHVK